MMEEASTRVFVVAATISGLLIALSALLANRKLPWTAWIMASGAGLATLGMAMTSLVAFDLNEWLRQNGEYPCCGSVCLGAMIFAIGFLMDQICNRAIMGNPFARHIPNWEDLSGGIGFGLLSISALTFTTGFLWDRIRRNHEDR